MLSTLVERMNNALKTLERHTDMKTNVTYFVVVVLNCGWNLLKNFINSLVLSKKL